MLNAPEVREPSDTRTLAEYSVRLTALAGFLLFIGLPAFSRYIHLNDVSVQLQMVERMDLYHAVFYGALPAAFLILFLPTPQERRLHPVLGFILAVAFGALCAWLPIRAGLHARPFTKMNLALGLSGAYIGLNVALMIWWRFGRQGAPGLFILVRRLYVLSDLLIPGPLWAVSYKATYKWIFHALRIVPAALVGLAAMVPWFLPAHADENRRSIDPSFRFLDGGAYFQALVDRHDGSVYLTKDIGSNELTKVTLGPSGSIDKKETDLGVDLIQTFAQDDEKRELVGLNPEKTAAVVIDPDSFTVKRVLPTNLRQKLNACRTLWHAPSGVLAAFCGIGTALFCPDGRTMIGHYTWGEPGDAVVDPDGSVIHEALITGSTYGPGLLVAMDGKTLEPKRWKTVPRAPERLVADPTSDRLFLSFPTSGRVCVLDRKTYEIEKWIRTFVGVRVLVIDVEGRSLILGGFSPFVEIRSLDDFSLIDRIVSPSHIRWISIDEKKDIAFVTSKSTEVSEMGLWAFDFRNVGGNSWKTRLRRADPFFVFMNETLILVHRLMGWDKADKNMKVVKPVVFRRDSCPAGDWRTDNGSSFLP